MIFGIRSLRFDFPVGRNEPGLHTTVDPCINIRVSCNIQIYFAILSVPRKYLETAYKTIPSGNLYFYRRIVVSVEIL